MSARSIKEVCEAIWAIERELGLLDWEVRGVRIWQALRFETYLRLCQRLALFDAADSAEGSRALGQVQLAGKLLYGALAKNPFAGDETFDALVFESSRSKVVDGKSICIYTHDLVAELTARGERVQLLERSEHGVHAKHSDARRAYLDAIELKTAIKRRVSKLSLRADEAARVRELEHALETKLGASVPLRSRIEDYIVGFWSDYAQYTRLFAKRKPRRVYCVCSYGRLAPMLKAAHDENIETVELQHGIVTRYHLGYSFPVLPETGTLEYFPRTFYSFGEPWQSLMQLPLAPDRIVARGFPYFERERSRYAKVARNAKQVLVLSQGVIGRQLADTILREIAALQGYEIVYKLHPGEYASWRQYESLNILSQKPNVRIVTDADLYELMAQSATQIGVFSTAIYEGLQFGCHTVLVDLPGIEYMADLIKAGHTESFQAFVARLRSETETERRMG